MVYNRRMMSIKVSSVVVALGLILTPVAPSLAATEARDGNIAERPTSANNDPARIDATNQWLKEKGYSETDRSTISAPNSVSSSLVASPAAIKFQNGRMSAQKFLNISNYNCCKGDISTGFVSYVKFGTLGIGATVNGDSYASWLGKKPSVPSKTTVTSDISRAGIGSVSVGKGGGSVKVDGKHVLIKSTSSKKWRTTQAYSDVKFGGAVASVSQDVKAEFIFGGASFNITAK